MAERTYLITGATGFLGRHLIHQLSQQENTRILALVRSEKSWHDQDWTSGLNVELVIGSVTCSDEWRDDPRLTHLDGIFHLAAVIRHTRQNPDEMFETNVGGLLQMIRLAAHHQCRLIFMSTSGTVGCFRSPKKWADESSSYAMSQVRRWPYYQSKIQAEEQGRALATKMGVELLIMRPPVLLGPGDHRLRASGHIYRMLRGKLPFTLKGGMHFVDIRDVTQAIIKAMQLKQVRPLYHFTGTECTIPDFFKMVEEVSGVARPRFALYPQAARWFAVLTQQIEKVLPAREHPILPDPVVWEIASKYWGLRSTHTKEDLGYQTRDPRQTMRDTVEWLRTNMPDLKAQSQAAASQQPISETL